ncbi:MAG: hypothetical protein ACYTAS_04825 [Planctomycetota bacterium]
MSGKTRLFLRIQFVIVFVLITTWAIKHRIIDIERAKSVLSAQMDHARGRIADRLEE